MRQPWWEWGMWMYRVSVAQANAGGGAIVVDFVPVAGVSMIVTFVRAENSGTNGLQILRVDEDNSVGPFYASVSSAATTQAVIPQSFSGATTDGVTFDSTDLFTRFFRANDKFTVQQTGAGAQNDTLVINLRAFLSCAERPIVTKGRSTNPSDVTIGTPSVDVIQ